MSIFNKILNNDYELPVLVDTNKKEDFFTPTKEYNAMMTCKLCTRTDGMTKTNSICQYCVFSPANINKEETR